MRNPLLSFALISSCPRARSTHKTRAQSPPPAGRHPFTGTKRSGACRGHGGVQSWGATSTATSPVATPPSPTASTSPRTAPSPSGGAGKVWVNTDSKVYHCPDDRWYGKTKHGSYMSEAEAQAQGVRPDHGKACTS
jgi:hypothetical protein